jgi:hypothetical protein
MGSQPTLSAALAPGSLSSESYAFQARLIDRSSISPFENQQFTASIEGRLQRL